jgi:hypothetical protein
LLEVLNKCVKPEVREKVPIPLRLQYSDSATDEECLDLIKGAVDGINQAVHYTRFPKEQQTIFQEQRAILQESGNAFFTPDSTPDKAAKDAQALCDIINTKLEYSKIVDLKAQLELIQTFDQLQTGDVLVRFNQFLSQTLE